MSNVGKNERYDIIHKANVCAAVWRDRERIARRCLRKNNILLQEWFRGRDDSTRHLAAHASLADPLVALLEEVESE